MMGAAWDWFFNYFTPFGHGDVYWVIGCIALAFYLWYMGWSVIEWRKSIKLNGYGHVETREWTDDIFKGLAIGVLVVIWPAALVAGILIWIGKTLWVFPRDVYRVYKSEPYGKEETLDKPESKPVASSMPSDRLRRAQGYRSY